MKDIVSRFWLVGAIALTVLVAVLLPGAAAAFVDWRLIDLGVIAVMFLGALKLEPRRFREAAGRLRLLALSLVSVFALAPLAALALAWLVGLDSGADRLGVLICAAQSSTLATAIVLTELAGGDAALAIVITLVNNTATVLLTPLAFHLLGGAEVEVDHLAMGAELAAKILAPVIAAQIARRWLAGWAGRQRRRLSIASQLIILTYIYTGVASSLDRLSSAGALLLRVVALVAALHLALLLINAALARLAASGPDERTAFVLCSSQKTLPAAILVWKSHFAALPIGPLVAVAYHLLQLVVDSLLAPGWKKLPLMRDRRRKGGSASSTFR